MTINRRGLLGLFGAALLAPLAAWIPRRRRKPQQQPKRVVTVTMGKFDIVDGKWEVVSSKTTRHLI